MLCVEDYLDALRWTNRMGGVPGLIERSQANFAVLGAVLTNGALLPAARGTFAPISCFVKTGHRFTAPTKMKKIIL